jgi:hypothetical protein
MSRLIHTDLGSSSHSTCPPLSSPPHANSFIIGPAVIKHTHTERTFLFSPRSLDRSTHKGSIRGDLGRVTSAVGDNHLPESLSGPCGWFRYHELNTHKVTKLVPPPACMASFCVFFFYRTTGRLRHTSLPLECHRKPTTRKHSGSNARHSTTA